MLSALSSQAETRAEFAERSVAKLEKTIDDLEGTNIDSTFSLYSLNTLQIQFNYTMSVQKQMSTYTVCHSLRCKL